MGLQTLGVIAFTHKNIAIDLLGKLVRPKEEIPTLLATLKNELHFTEVFYIGTCNRVELVFCVEQSPNDYMLKKLIDILSKNLLLETEKANLLENLQVFQAENALNHLMRVSASLESMVVGEKEILAQVRQAYDEAKACNATGDFLRLCMNRIVKTAKEIYTNTKISEKPISVVSIAYRSLRELNINEDTRFILIGAGETNQLFAKYLRKLQFKNFSIFNRTLSKAETLAAELGAKAYPLDELANFKQGFDVIITCTGAVEPIINLELYHSLLNGESDRKIVLDLGIPNDTHPDVLKENIRFIGVQTIQKTIQKNIEDRHAELCSAEQIIEENLAEFRPILRQRKVELAMQGVPVKIKEIRQVAIQEVFAQELKMLDPQSVEVLDKVLNYMEKKYISIPMLMAKDILVNE
jgi:glutamyl-tRNA reductase